MIGKIIHYSIHNKVVVGMGTLALIAWGLYSLSHLALDAVPDITDNQVQVITTSPTLAAQEVERFITYPLEISLANIPRVLEIRSVSRFGLSVITVVFEEDMDTYLSRQLIQERIKAAEEDIPEGLGKPEMGPITTGLGMIYQYVIATNPGYDSVYSPTDLRTIQDWIVKRQLVSVPGVIEVNSSGGFVKQYEVALDPDKLRAMGITITEVFDALAANNQNSGGSYIEKEPYTYFIRGEGILTSFEDIGAVVISIRDGIPILIKDVARLQFGSAPRFGAVTMDGEGERVAGQVMMLKGENSAEVTERVKERMKLIETSLPEGIRIEPFLDRSKLVARTTATVSTNLIEGGLIVIFILVLLLGNFRAGLIVATVIPLSMLFAIGMMQVFGVSANLMSLGAVDFGLIVDGAVIIVEAVVHQLQQKHRGQQLNREEMDTAVFGAASRIQRSASFGYIIILIVYLPILALVGIEGKMFRPMAQTVSFAIIGALILSLTYVPMMTALFLNKTIRTKATFADRIIEGIRRIYSPVLEVALRAKAIVIGLTVAAFIASLWVLNGMGGEFIPTLEEGDFALHQILPPGSSLQQSVEVSAVLQNMLLDSFPEVDKVVTKIGTAEIPTDIMPLEAGDIYVMMKPRDEWTSAHSRQEMFERMEEKMSEMPGVMYEFTQPIQMQFNELMTGIRQDIAVKIYGEDLGILFQKGKEAESIIQRISGVGDIKVEQLTGLQQMVIRYDRARIARYGLSIREINQVVETAFAGGTAGAIFEGEKRFDLVVRLDHPFRKGIEDLRNLYIALPNGEQIPLSKLARIEFEEGPTQISRDDTRRRITVGVNTRNRDTESLVTEIQERLEAELELPAGYYLRYGGQFENLQKAKDRLFLAVPIALGLIFALLYLTFHSFKQAILIFTAVPMSIIGGVLALYIRDLPFSISAGIGFIALFGVAVLNGIVLIGYFNQLKEEGMTDLSERIRTGTRLRLRPVLLTALVASLGFLPMAISQSDGAEVQRPLATVVIGGLITATLLTLVVLPLLYYYVEKGWKNSKSVVAGLIVLLGMAGSLQAQGLSSDTLEISLENALEMAGDRHPALRQARLKVEQQAALKKTVFNPSPTQLFYRQEEWDGTANNGVSSIGFQQNFPFPTAVSAAAKLQDAKRELAERSGDITYNQLNRNIRQAYLEWLYADLRVAQMLKMDSLYRDFVRVADLRLQTGETGKLPTLTARSKHRQIQLQEQQSLADRQTALVLFNQWLGADTVFVPESVSPDSYQPAVDTSLLRVNSSPQVQYFNQVIAVANSQLRVQKNQLAPQITTSLLSQRLNGAGGFWGYQIGLNVPLFFGAKRAQIQAADLATQAATANYQAQAQTWQRWYEQQLNEYNKLRTSLTFYEVEALDLADEQIRTAERSYQSGESDYLDYIQLLDQAAQIRMTYLDTWKACHQRAIDLSLLNSPISNP